MSQFAKLSHNCSFTLMRLLFNPSIIYPNLPVFSLLTSKNQPWLSLVQLSPNLLQLNSISQTEIGMPSKQKKKDILEHCLKVSDQGYFGHIKIRTYWLEWGPSPTPTCVRDLYIFSFSTFGKLLSCYEFKRSIIELLSLCLLAEPAKTYCANLQTSKLAL